MDTMDKDTLQACYAAAGLDLNLRELYATAAGPVLGTWIGGGDAAVALWEKLRELTAQTGYWPLLTGSQLPDLEDIEALAAMTESAVPAPQDWIEQARGIDVKTYFADRISEIPDPEEEASEWEDWAEEVGLADSLGAARNLTAYFTPFDILTGKPLEKLGLALVPTRNGSEAAAYVHFGGWNACPDPASQVAIQSYWQQHHGAEPVAMTGDVLEMKVLRPPMDEAAALELAHEHYLFCDDIVLQGVMTVENLKNSLLASPLWYFWWD